MNRRMQAVAALCVAVLAAGACSRAPKPAELSTGDIDTSTTSVVDDAITTVPGQDPADPSAPPRLVAAGKADIAITYQPDFMLQIEEGLPLVNFGTLIDTPLNALIALRDGPVKGLEDLRGKRIGYSVASIQQAYLDAMLASVGLTADDVTLVNVNFNLQCQLQYQPSTSTVNFELHHEPGNL